MATLEVTICGGGRTGHLDAVLFSRRPGVRVSWLTTNPEVVNGAAAGSVKAVLPDGRTIAGEPAQVGTDPAIAVRHADLIVLTVPANARADTLRAIAPHLPRDKPVYIGAIPGFCGFDWLAEDLLAGRPNAVIWGMKDVSHTAFDLRPGCSVRMGGAKSRLHVATHRRESVEARAALAAHLETLFEAPVEMLSDYLEITLTPGNPIMHSSVIYGLIGPSGEWRDRPLPEGFCWWTDCPERGAYYLERCDEENQRLRCAAEAKLGVDLSSVKPLKMEIEDAYLDQIVDTSSMLTVLRTNRAYDAIRAPLVFDEGVGGYIIDKQSRAFQEDIVFGLALLVRLAEQLDVETPCLKEIYAWAIDHMGGHDREPLSYVPAHLHGCSTTQASEPRDRPQSDAVDAVSRRNAIRRLARCLFAEGILDIEHLEHGETDLRLRLPERNAQLTFARAIVAPARTVLVDGPITLISDSGASKAVEDPAELLDLLVGQFDFRPSAEGLSAVKADVANSIANDRAARRFRRQWNDALQHRIAATGESDLPGFLRRHACVRDNVIFLDQWGALEGHPFYPTWKTRPSLSEDEVAALSPEFAARVPVRIAALREDTAFVETMPGISDPRAWFANAFPEVWSAWRRELEARSLNVEEWLPLPIHTWHLDAFVREHFAADVSEGTLVLEGPDMATAPSMSYRTMMPEGPPDSPFIKLPIALWMTSEQRSLQAKSIHMGPRNSAVIKTILERENGFDGRMTIYPEEVAYHYRHAARRDDAPGKNLSVVFRATASALAACEGKLPVPVAALFTGLPGSGRPFVTALIEAGGRQTDAASITEFFRTYARTVIRPVVGIYLLYGIGLEAHQQNTSVVFDADNRAQSIVVRDFGDGRSFGPLLESRGLRIEPYVNPPILPTVFRDDIEPVRTFVIDACYVCHLHELALALTAEYSLPNARLWDVLREETALTFADFINRVDADFLARERNAFLEAPWTTRSVLRMHLTRYTDYRMQHGLPNPLRIVQPAA